MTLPPMATVFFRIVFNLVTNLVINCTREFDTRNTSPDWPRAIREDEANGNSRNHFPGPIVDNMALYDASRSGKISFAALDVTEPEPMRADHPLLTLDNVIVAPHIASASVATRTKMALMAVDNLIAGLKGEMPPTPVDPEVLKKS